MPQLENPRHERFAQAIAKGASQREAYLDAGYSGTTGAVDVSAHRLLSQPKVAARVTELQQKAAARVEVTVSWLLETAQGIIQEARTAQDYSAASMTLERAAKIAGLWVDRSEQAQTVRTVTDEPMTPDQWQQQHAAPHQSLN